MELIKNFLWVGLGGAVGSILRYGLGLALPAKPFPFGTLLINISGSLAIGLLMGISIKQDHRLLLITGLCGGFTTFSAFALENIQLLNQQKYFLAITYIGLSLFLSLIAVWLGIKFTGN